MLSTVAPLAAILLASTSAHASPTTGLASPSVVNQASIPLNHNHAFHARQNHPDLEIRQAWLKNQARNLRRKYSSLLDERGEELMARDNVYLDMVKRDLVSRQSQEGSTLGEEYLIDVGLDASYTGTLYMGTPAQEFEVIMDTGSSDLWLADSECTSRTCQGISSFNEGASSTLNMLGTPFQIQYGSGAANGTLAQDTAYMAGYTVQSQTFALVTEASDDLLTYPYSGLMGLAWARLASSRSTPFWQALAQTGQLATPAMGFYMARFRGDYTATRVEENGGLMTLGYLNSSLYEGNITYVSIADDEKDYWRIPMGGIRVGDNAIAISQYTGDAPSAAIDTGTTLIGGPTSAVESLYAAIPGSRAATVPGYEGYYEYPCSTTVNMRMVFGSVSYLISEADFNLGAFSQDSQYCMGAVFAQDLGSQAPIQWIVGATFLKNVYSVFSYEPAAIGFAPLAGEAKTATTASGANALPSSTGSSTAGSSQNAAVSLMSMTSSSNVIASLLVALVAYINI